MKKLCCTLILLGVISSSLAQLNSYKYIIVPKRFDIFTEDNMYQTSTLVKFLFDEEGYNVIYDDELPPDLVNQRCLGLLVNLEKQSTLTRTKMIITLNDCNSIEIFRSPEGTSKSKEFREAYHESIRQAFKIFEGMSYSYKPKEEEGLVVDFSNDIKDVQEKSDRKAVEEAAVVQVATPEEQSYKDLSPQPSEYTKGNESDQAETKKMEAVQAEEIWQAKELENGYELLNNQTGANVKLFKTSAPDVYLAKYGKVDGMVYRKDSKWFLEYYKNSELVVEELYIQF